MVWFWWMMGRWRCTGDFILIQTLSAPIKKHCYDKIKRLEVKKQLRSMYPCIYLLVPSVLSFRRLTALR